MAGQHPGRPWTRVQRDPSLRLCWRRHRISRRRSRRQRDRSRDSAARASSAARVATTSARTGKGSATASTGPWRNSFACRRDACTTFPIRCRSTSPVLPSPTPWRISSCASTRVITPGDFVVVIGPGPIGLLCARMAALSWCQSAHGRRPDRGIGLVSKPRGACARPIPWISRRRTSKRSLAGPLSDRRRPGSRCNGSKRLRSARHCELTRPDGQVSKVGWSPDVIVTDVNPLVHRKYPSARVRSATTTPSGSV